MPEIAKESPDIKKLNINVVLYNILFPGLFLFISQGFGALYNPSVRKPAIERILLSLQPTVVILFIIFLLIVLWIVFKVLKPLRRYLLVKENYDKARFATVKLPWILFFLHGGFWISGVMIFYGLNNWSAPGGQPLLWSLALNVTGGIIGALFTSLMLELKLLGLKRFLEITEIKKGENDKFMRNRDQIVIFIIVITIILYSLYAMRYFLLNSYSKELHSFFAYTVLGILGGCGGFVLFLQYILKRTYKYKISALNNKLENLTSGKTDIKDRMLIVHFDEIGDLTNKINRFLDYYDSLLSTIKETVYGIKQAVNELASLSSQGASSSQEQSASVKEIYSTMQDSEEMSATIAEKIETVSSEAKLTNDTVEAGVNIVEKNKNTMKNIKNSNEEIKRGIDKLAGSVNSIKDIIKIINSVAEQTKIIAFNAELESVSVKMEGHNFEIVANEIRRLANSTAESTKDIRKKLNDIRNDYENVMKISEASSTLIDKGTGLSENLEQEFNRIRNSASTSTGSAKNISSSIKQQSSAFEQIVGGMKQISIGVDEYAESAKAVYNASTELSNMAERLETIIKANT